MPATEPEPEPTADEVMEAIRSYQAAESVVRQANQDVARARAHLSATLSRFGIDRYAIGS